MSFKAGLSFIVCGFMLGACTHSAKVKQEPVLLVLKPELKKDEVNQYHSRSSSFTYKGGLLERKKEEQLDFKIKSQALKVNADLDPNKTEILYEITSFDKSGDGNLNDFAFPEVGKKLKVSLLRTGDVIKVDGYATDSVFYVPPISLPPYPVNVGDTWAMKKGWRTAEDKIPLEVEAVTIFKRKAPCGDEQCAVLEVSGEVKIAEMMKAAKLTSEINGVILFSIDSGRVLWSSMKSSQVLETQMYKTDISNCLTSYALYSGWDKLEQSITPYCRIEDDINPDKIPGL